MDRPHEEAARHAAPRLLIEVTGVAGAGKSTVARVFAKRQRAARVADFIRTRELSHLPYVARGLATMLPLVVAGTLHGDRRLTWRECKLLVYVSTWDRFLATRPEYAHGTTLLDQGPLYALVRLRGQSADVTRGGAFDRWSNAMLERWARELHVVVWLDAPNEVLWDRIHGRDQHHATRNGSRDAGFEFLDRYRALFDDVVGRVDAPGGPLVLRFDTGARSPEEIAAELASLLERGTTTALGGPDGR